MSNLKQHFEGTHAYSVDSVLFNELSNEHTLFPQSLRTSPMMYYDFVDKVRWLQVEVIYIQQVTVRKRKTQRDTVQQKCKHMQRRQTNRQGSEKQRLKQMSPILHVS